MYVHGEVRVSREVAARQQRIFDDAIGKHPSCCDLPIGLHSASGYTVIDFFEIPEDLPPYQMANNCGQCQTTFTMFRRRHHCRNCGMTVCDAHRRVGNQHANQSLCTPLTNPCFTPIISGNALPKLQGQRSVAPQDAERGVNSRVCDDCFCAILNLDDNGNRRERRPPSLPVSGLAGLADW
mmetsp:Transcript_17919/g.46993  ORF Transcript_17919/g.46993 Transcript_17919/m.46993 type:complete len:181 (+) Transcript_17919:966-1508(+)